MPKQSKTGKNKWISLGHVISIFARGLGKTREIFVCEIVHTTDFKNTCQRTLHTFHDNVEQSMPKKVLSLKHLSPCLN